MRVKRRHLKSVYVSTKTTTKSPTGAVIEGWSAPERHVMGVYPLGDSVTAQAYGERSLNMLKLIGKASGLKAGQAVWLGGENLESDPLWEIARVEEWPNQTTALIERRVV